MSASPSVDLLADFLPPVASVTDVVLVYKTPLAYAFPILVIIAAIIFVVCYRRTTKKDDRTVIAEYEPPSGLTPGELGLMANLDLESNRLVFAELAGLVGEGYVKMEGYGPQAVFKPTEKYDPQSFRLKDHQRRLLRALFDQAPQRAFGEIVPLSKEAFQGEVLARAVTSGYLRMDPRQAKGAARDVSIGMLLVGFGSIGWIVSFLYTFFRVQIRTRVTGAWALYVAIYLSIIQKILNVALLSQLYPEGTIFSHAFLLPSVPEFLIAITAAIALNALPQRTPSGNALKRDIDGFMDYLKTAEQGRIEFAEGKEGKITDLSSYALALGLPSKWDRVFVLSETNRP